MFDQLFMCKKGVHKADWDKDSTLDHSQGQSMPRRSYLWIELLPGTVPANKLLLVGTVPANKLLLARTVPVNKFLLAGTPKKFKFQKNYAPPQSTP